MTAGTPTDASARCTATASRLTRVSTAMSPGSTGRQPSPSAQLLLAQRAQDLRGDVARTRGRGPCRRAGWSRRPARAERRARHLPDAHRRPAAQPPARPRRLDRVHDDAGVAERGAGQDRGEPVEHGRVGAPVAVQRLRGRVGAGAQVGGDVGAAEPVDRLLRVADEHEGAVPVERGPQDVPLHRVGVLELVDHDDAVPRADPLRGGGPVSGSVSASRSSTSRSS